MTDFVGHVASSCVCAVALYAVCGAVSGKYRKWSFLVCAKQKLLNPSKPNLTLLKV